MKLFIKNIAGLTNLMLVKNELDKLGFRNVSLDESQIDVGEGLTVSQHQVLRLVLQKAGIEVFTDKKEILVQQIKNVIAEIVYHSKEPLVHNLSTHLVERLHHDYTYMSNLFSETQHITIEKFYICHKIERVKELLVYEKMTLTEIAYKMHYSSLAHLSGQFRKVTGMTTSQFKNQYRKDEIPPEDCG